MALAPSTEGEQNIKDVKDLSSVCEMFGFRDGFLEGQLEAARCILQKKHTFVLRNTNGGKTFTFLAPIYAHGLRKEAGLHVVVVPLLALQADFVDRVGIRALRKTVEVLDFTRSTDEVAFLGALENSLVKTCLVFMNPEQMLRVRPALVQYQKVVRSITFDEVHLICKWKEFRDFTAVKGITDLLPHATVVACSATAPLSIRQDFAKLIGLDTKCFHLCQNYEARENITYRVIPYGLVKREAAALTQAERFPMIIFLRRLGSRVEAETLVGSIEGIKILSYCANQSDAHKASVQKDFCDAKAGEKVVLIATVAFGTGIDARHVRSCILFGLPSELDDVAQLCGRVGRDHAPSWATIVVRPSDTYSRPVKVAFGVVSVRDKEQGEGPMGMVKCELCLTWRKALLGLPRTFSCPLVKLRCIGRIALPSCLPLLFRRYATDDYGTECELVGAPRVKCKQCEFCLPATVAPTLVPAIGTRVKVVNEKIVIAGMVGIVVDVKKGTQLSLQLPYGPPRLTGFRNVSVMPPTTAAVPGPVIGAVAISKERRSALLQLLNACILSLSRDLKVPFDALARPRDLLRLAQFAPATVEGCRTLSAWFIEEEACRRLVQVIVAFLHENVPVTTNALQHKRRRQGDENDASDNDAALASQGYVTSESTFIGGTSQRGRQRIATKKAAGFL